MNVRQPMSDFGHGLLNILSRATVLSRPFLGITTCLKNGFNKSCFKNFADRFRVTTYLKTIYI